MKLLPFILGLGLLVSCVYDATQPRGPLSIAVADIYLVSTTDSETYTVGDQIGTAEIFYQDGISELSVSLTNMTPGSSHAMHLHMGTLESPGHHWNQDGTESFCNARSLGQVWAKPFAGDVGNITIDEEGNGNFFMETDLWSVDTSDNTDVLGTVLYIHENFEDFTIECDPNHDHEHGHANPKIAGGTIVFDETID